MRNRLRLALDRVEENDAMESGSGAAASAPATEAPPLALAPQATERGASAGVPDAEAEADTEMAAEAEECIIRRRIASAVASDEGVEAASSTPATAAPDCCDTPTAPVPMSAASDGG